MIKAAVDFRRVEVFGDERERIELRAGAFRIDAAAPVCVRPSGWTNEDVTMRRHAAIVAEAALVCRRVLVSVPGAVATGSRSSDGSHDPVATAPGTDTALPDVNASPPDADAQWPDADV